VIVDGSPITVLGDGQNEDPVQSPSFTDGLVFSSAAKAFWKEEIF
jgi:hypothetical protein